MLKDKYQNRFIKLLCFNTAMFILFFGMFVFHKHFSTDDYYAYERQNIVASEVVVFSYRNFLGFLYFILDKIHINVVEHQILFGCILILSFSWCASVIANEINKQINRNDSKHIFFFIDMGAVILFANAFVSEWLWFSLGYLQWIFSVFGITYGAVFIVKKTHLLKNWIFCVICLFIVAGSYQILLADYVFLVMFFVFINAKGNLNKESVLLIFRSAIPAVLSVILNILLSRVLFRVYDIPYSSGRMNVDFSEIWLRICQIADCQKIIWIDSIELLPKYFALVYVLLLSCLLFSMIRKRVRPLTYLFIFGLLISGQCVMYMAFIVSGIWMPARTMVPIYGIYAVLVWLICYYTRLENKKSVYLCIAVEYLFALFLIVNVVSIRTNATDAIKTNAIDRFYMKAIDAYIAEYEQSQNLKIQSIGFCNDASLTTKYNDYIINNKYFGEMSTRCFATNWSVFTSFKYYTNRQLEQIEVPEQIRTEFSNRDWSVPLFEQQIVFDGSSVYICVY